MPSHRDTFMWLIFINTQLNINIIILTVTYSLKLNYIRYYLNLFHYL